ncbi:MAG: YggS family pyridoxal phosphate-dependent enzyme, partial [Anaerolineae bacterium]|nr:YggS family pyridoxal phosphate-dependent enzyme [Anaerolineae bacterium]
MKGLEANLRSVQGRIVSAASRAGRDPDEITLVAVTKTRSPTIIRAAYDLGLRHFG